MECLSPAHYNDADVGCGRCIACRINTTRDWALRLNHESYEYGWHNCSFLTLTIDEKHNYDNSVHINDLSNFFDDIKNKGFKIKRLGVSEYGTENERPHYHAVCFGLPPDQKELVQSQWPQGFTATLPYVGSATGNYVAGYVLKKLYGELADETYAGREPPSLRASNGIGKTWCEKHAEEIRRDGLIYDNYGQAHRVPRYYRKLLDLDMSSFMMDRDRMVLTHNEKLVKRSHPVRLAEVMAQYHNQIDHIMFNNDYIAYFKLMEVLASREQKLVTQQRRLNTMAKLKQRRF